MFNKILVKVKTVLFKKTVFEDIENRKNVCLYAGDIPENGLYDKFIGLSVNKSDFRHIKHDVTKKMPLEDESVDIYQSEDVFEHIEKNKIPSIINEIYRVLKPGGVFRLSLPDYRCDILYDRSVKDTNGQILFDPEGGGGFENGKVVNGGHLWFPIYEEVVRILEKTNFQIIKFYHYYDSEGKGITKPIDYSIAHVMRTPDFDNRISNPYRPMSIVVDCIK